MALRRRPTLAAVLYGLSLAVLLTAPLNPRDRMTHGFLTMERYDSPRRMVKDIVQNLLAFAPFGLLLRRAARRSASGPQAEFVAAVMLATAFAITMESIQSVLPGRYSSLIDVAVDGMGAALGAGVGPMLIGRPHRLPLEVAARGESREELIGRSVVGM